MKRAGGWTKDGNDVAVISDLSMLLDHSTIADGGQLTEPVAFVQRLNRLLLQID